MLPYWATSDRNWSIAAVERDGINPSDAWFR
jgi:hypothetical protein